MGVLSILLLFSACISITWSADVIDLEKARTNKAMDRCPSEFYRCLSHATAPRQRRQCILHFSKCVRSAFGDNSFQSLRRQYKDSLKRFERIVRDFKRE
ncbi:hypothetical protein ScPMuIL_000348 [Solemya velum]